MTIYYLYVKTHNITGLKYLGKTKQDPYKYGGSGIMWRAHIKKHGYEVTTEILKECQTHEELKYWGLHYSTAWNVVNSRDSNGNKIWANLVPEEGQGFPSKQFNPRYDAIVYHWENIETLETVLLTQSDFIARYNLEQSHVSMLVSGKCKSCQGWHIYGRPLNDNKGYNNYQHDPRIFKWVNVITDQVLIMDRYQFAESNNVKHSGNLSKVINKKRTTINNFIIDWT